MKILILSPPDSFHLHALEAIKTGIQKQLREFTWEVTTSVEDFESKLDCFKISADLTRSNTDCANLKWPNPIDIMKDANVKSRIWEEIQLKVIPQFNLVLPGRPPLVITNEDLQRLLGMIGSASQPFRLKLLNGDTVGVNIDNSDSDIRLNSGDIASMLAASWIFGSTQIQVPKDVDIAELQCSK